MAEHADEHERTMAFAEIALGQIKALRQAATPRNYEIWYSLRHRLQPVAEPDDQRDAQARTARCPKPTSSESTTPICRRTRLTERIDNVGNKVMDEIEQVMAMIDAAVGSATSYTESLADMSEKLGQSKDREGVRAIVESLVQTAKEMEDTNQQLEERLNASKLEINELQENLEVVRTESLTDPLTRLANRKFFDNALELGHRRRRAPTTSRCR